MEQTAKTTETKGKVIFSSQRNAVFRFVVTPERIWLEQQSTKEQWECTVSSANDFALKGAGIPHTIVMDYLAMSLGCMSDGRESTNCEVDLIGMSDDRLRLDFLLEFAISGVVWKPEYQFVLQRVQVTETQVLEAKLVDAKEDLENLHLIVPAWVLGGDDRIVSRNEAALQFAALTGAKLWFHLCSLAKWALGLSVASVDTATEWIGAALHTATHVIAKYWWTTWGSVKQVGGTVHKRLGNKIEETVTYYSDH